MNYRVNLSAENIEDMDLSNFKGVGLIRSEFILWNSENYITEIQCQDDIEAYCEMVCKKFQNEEIWYRTYDLATDQMSALKGFIHNAREKETLLGIRGARHSLMYVQDFRKELAAFYRVARKYHNLNILFPFISSTTELESCLSELESINYQNKVGIMAEIPSVIILLDEFIEMGISNVTIGINDLTSCILGTNRNRLHDICHKAVLKVIREAIEKCKRKNIQVSVAGNMTSEFVEFMKEYDPDYLILQIRELDLLDNKLNRTTSVWHNHE